MFVQVASTILYVLPFYLSPSTRPSPNLSRDAPSVIRARIRSVFLSTSLCTLFAIYILSTHASASLAEGLRLLGWYPVSVIDIAKALLLTVLLFAGPVFEKGIIESGWKSWITGQSLYESLSSWIGWRNYVAVSIRCLDPLQQPPGLTTIHRDQSRRRSSFAPCSLQSTS